jgi:transglutaminase-like putative cysteine protease
VANGRDPRLGEVYLPGPGWTGFDPTVGALSGADHVAVAVSHHPEKVPPVAGDFLGPAGAGAALHVTVSVQVLPPFELAGDPGTYTLPEGSIEATSGAAPGSCDVAATVIRSRRGRIDPALDPESRFVLEQARTVSFVSGP